MNKTKFIAGIAMGLFCSSAFAVDSWEGDKFIYSTSSKYDSVAYKIKIDGDKVTVVAPGSQSKGLVTSQNGEVKIQLEAGSMKRIGFPFVLNPVTGVEEQVPAEQTTEQIVLSGKKKDLRMKFKGTSCFDYDNNGIFEACESSDSKLGKKFDLVLKSKLKKIATDISEGSSVTLPLPKFNSAFVTVGVDGAAESAQDGISANDEIKKLIKIGKSIVATMADGSTITYGQIGKNNGISRVIGIQRTGTAESLVYGLMAKDLKPGLNREALLGTYSPVGNKNVSYIFNDEGLGMFTTTNPGGELVNNPWTWEFKNGELEAKRYRFVNGPSIETEKEMLTCIDSGVSNCLMFNRRSYKILSQDGDKFVLLRKFEFISNSDFEDQSPLVQHVQIMKKKKEKK